jgi:hypothetical protein
MLPTNIGLAEDIGRAIGLALRTATPAGAMPTATKGTDVVRPYTKDKYALIMGFATSYEHKTYHKSGGILQHQK